MPANTPLIRYLSALYATAPPESFVELRVRAAESMSRAFLPADDLAGIAAAIARFAPHADTFVGVLPRARRGGGRADLVARGAVAWADCDTDESVTKLERFTPRPSVVVASGTATNRHAYWVLCDASPISEIEAANRALARNLGADQACVDGARILRPPGTLNRKRRESRPVRLEHLDLTDRHDLAALVGGRGNSAHLPEPRRPVRRRAGGDRLTAIPPPVYVERLTGRPVPRSRKVRCPLHDDRTPSLHAYPEPGAGWYCFGCGRGGSIYDLAGLLWGVTPRGSDFLRLHDELIGVME